MKWIGVILMITYVIAVKSASDSPNLQEGGLNGENNGQEQRIRRIVQDGGENGENNGQRIRRIVQDGGENGENNGQEQRIRRIIQENGLNGESNVTLRRIASRKIKRMMTEGGQGEVRVEGGAGGTRHVHRFNETAGRGSRHVHRISGRYITHIHRITGRGRGGRITVGGEGGQGVRRLQLTSSQIERIKAIKKRLIQIKKERGKINCRKSGVTGLADSLNVGLQTLANQIANGFGANKPDPDLFGRIFGGAQTTVDETIGGLDQGVSDFFCGFNRVFNKIGTEIYKGNFGAAALKGGEVFTSGAGSLFGNGFTNAVGAAAEGISDVVYGRRSREAYPIVHSHHGDLTDVI